MCWLPRYYESDSFRGFGSIHINFGWFRLYSCWASVVRSFTPDPHTKVSASVCVCVRTPHDPTRPDPPNPDFGSGRISCFYSTFGSSLVRILILSDTLRLGPVLDLYPKYPKISDIMMIFKTFLLPGSIIDVVLFQNSISSMNFQLGMVTPLPELYIAWLFDPMQRTQTFRSQTRRFRVGRVLVKKTLGEDRIGYTFCISTL